MLKALIRIVSAKPQAKLHAAPALQTLSAAQLREVAGGALPRIGGWGPQTQGLPRIGSW